MKIATVTLAPGMKPQIESYVAESGSVRETGALACESCSGPPRPKSHWPPKIAIQFSMIVEMTSCAPRYALRKPAIAAQAEPIRAAPRVASSTASRPWPCQWSVTYSAISTAR